MIIKSAIHLESREIITAGATDEHCPRCDENMIFKHDRDNGYSKSCQNCGHIKYLHRRFLRWNRQHERWE